MTQISIRLVAILLLLGLITSTPLMTYDPTTGATSQAQTHKDTALHRWFYKRTITAGSSF